MKNELNITLIQAALVWENPEANRNQFSEKIAALTTKTDLIVLPEMFTTGFTMNAEALAEEAEGTTLKWMQSQASTYDTAITGSVIVKEGESYFNRLYFVFPTRDVVTYDKKHTFTLAGEHKIYTAGTKKLLVDYKGWKLCPLVCYDLRFPVWSRNTEDYDVLLYVANWPEKRIKAWDTLLQARAIENMSYCIGVNRVGMDGNGHSYVGHSAVYDVLGEQISTAENDVEFTQTIILDKEHITQHRKHLQFLVDRDRFTLE